MTGVNFGELLTSGYHTWKKNLNICIPFILNALVTIALVSVVSMIFLFSIFLPLLGNFISNPSALTSTEIISEISSVISNNLISIGALIIILGILVGLINSFFTSGAIGMVNEVLTKGTANLSHMISYGKKKYLSFFGASLLIGLVFSIGILFIIPGLLQIFSNIESFTSGITTQGATAILSFVIGFIPMVIYMLIMSIVLALVPYAVILDDQKAVEGFTLGIRVFLKNKVNVFLLWLLVLVFGILIGLINMIPFIGWIIMLIVMFIFFMPINTIWWSKLYILITKPKKN